MKSVNHSLKELKPSVPVSIPTKPGHVSGFFYTLCLRPFTLTIRPFALNWNHIRHQLAISSIFMVIFHDQNIFKL